MTGLGIGFALGLSQRKAAAGPSLLPAQTAMLVAGDSLSGQATAGSDHPLCWATRKGGFDVDYNYRLHNIGVSSTTTDSAPNLIAVTTPASQNVPRGLIHPDRIARDSGYVASTGAKVLMLDVGTNSVPGTGAGAAAPAFANVQAYVAAMRQAGVAKVILGTLQPRMSGTSTPTAYMTAVQGQNCRDYNGLLLGWAASDPAIHVYDGSAGEVDSARTAEYGPIGGGSNSVPGCSTFDGIHWGTAHAARREDELVAALARIFPVRPDRAYSRAAEYSWSSNRYKNILGAAAGFSGAGAWNPYSGGPTGSFGDGWVCNSGSALPAGVSIVGTQVQVQYGGQTRDAIRIEVSGTSASDFAFQVQTQSAIPIGTDADNGLRMDGNEKILHEWIIEFDAFSGCRFIGIDLSIPVPGGAVGADSSGASAFLPPINGRYVWREPSVGPITAAQTSCIPKMILRFKGGQPVSGSFTLIHAFLGHVA